MPNQSIGQMTEASLLIKSSSDSTPALIILMIHIETAWDRYKHARHCSVYHVAIEIYSVSICLIGNLLLLIDHVFLLSRFPLFSLTQFRNKYKRKKNIFFYTSIYIIFPPPFFRFDYRYICGAFHLIHFTETTPTRLMATSSCHSFPDQKLTCQYLCRTRSYWNLEADEAIRRVKQMKLKWNWRCATTGS